MSFYDSGGYLNKGSVVQSLFKLIHAKHTGPHTLNRSKYSRATRAYPITHGVFSTLLNMTRNGTELHVDNARETGILILKMMISQNDLDYSFMKNYMAVAMKLKSPARTGPEIAPIENKLLFQRLLIGAGTNWNSDHIFSNSQLFYQQLYSVNTVNEGFIKSNFSSAI